MSRRAAHHAPVARGDPGGARLGRRALGGAGGTAAFRLRRGVRARGGSTRRRSGAARRAGAAPGRVLLVEALGGGGKSLARLGPATGSLGRGQAAAAHGITDSWELLRREASAAARRRTRTSWPSTASPSTRRPYIVMARCADRRSRRCGCPRAAALRWCRRRLAVEHTHRRGIVHRDRSPATSCSTRTTACGCSTSASRTSATRRAHETGQVMGTPGFMSPEQAGGDVSASHDPRTDVYSLGATLTLLADRRRSPATT